MQIFYAVVTSWYRDGTTDMTAIPKFLFPGPSWLSKPWSWDSATGETNQDGTNDGTEYSNNQVGAGTRLHACMAALAKRRS